MNTGSTHEQAGNYTIRIRESFLIQFQFRMSSLGMGFGFKPLFVVNSLLNTILT
jgi:hypothetical protein